jgi:hypothetical protein
VKIMSKAQAVEKVEVDHAYQNAQAWAESIAEMVAALECDYDRLQTLRDERESLVEEQESASGILKDNGKPSDEELAAGHALSDWDEENGEELADLTTAATLEGVQQTSADDVRERIQESPLEVSVRSGWYAPGSEDNKPEDFLVLLSTGGPALRIRGDLNQHGEPDRAWLEYQDWGTPWTEYHGEGCEQSTLLTFCRQFYFGE